MRITWNNLLYYVIAIVSFHFVMIYCYSVKRPVNEHIAVNNNHLPSPIAFLLENDTVEDNQAIIGNDTVIESNWTNSSIPEEIGKSISSSYGPLPYPETGKLQKFLGENSKSDSAQQKTSTNSAKTISLLFYLIVGLVVVNIGICYYRNKKKVEEAQASIKEMEDKQDSYALLSSSEIR